MRVWPWRRPTGLHVGWFCARGVVQPFAEAEEPDNEAEEQRLAEISRYYDAASMSQGDESETASPPKASPSGPRAGAPPAADALFGSSAAPEEEAPVQLAPAPTPKAAAAPSQAAVAPAVPGTTAASAPPPNAAGADKMAKELSQEVERLQAALALKDEELTAKEAALDVSSRTTRGS